MKRPQTSINTGLAAIFTLFYLQKSRFSILKILINAFPPVRIAVLPSGIKKTYMHKKT